VENRERQQLEPLRVAIRRCCQAGGAAAPKKAIRKSVLQAAEEARGR
jgi:hypothetical protein